MAPRTTYGKTAWGKYFIETLESHYDEGRLQRGRSYANTGKVAQLDWVGLGVRAKVRGNYQPWYRVSLEFPPFSEAERSTVVAHLGARPDWLAGLATGTLSAEVVNHLSRAGISLLPRDWGKLGRRCDCPDFGDPCKHMAAVFYSLAAEIDQNPLRLFLLRGLDLKAEFPALARTTIPPPLVLRERSEGRPPPAEAPELRLEGHFIPLVLSLLRAAPSFSDRDYKVVLAEFYHHAQRRYEATLTLGTPEPERRLSETEFSLAADSLEWVGVHPSHGTSRWSLLDLAPSFLASPSDQGTPTFRFLFHLYRLLYLVVRAGAWGPAVMVHDHGFCIVWTPLGAVPELRTLIGDVGALAPELFWADGPSTVAFLLAGLCTELAVRLDFRPSGTPGPLDAVFFQGESHEAESLGFRSTPAALAGWLAVLNQGTGAYRYRFLVDDGYEPGSFELSVSLRPADPQTDSPWVAMAQAAQRADAVEALGLATLLGGFVPELAELRTRESVVLPEDRLIGFLSEAAPVLSRLGVEVVLPKPLSKALNPRLSVRASSKGQALPGGHLSAQELADFDWVVTVGDQKFTRTEFEALVKRSRGVVRFKDGYLTLEADQLRKLLEPTLRPPSFRDALADFLDGAPAFDAAVRATFEGLFRPKALEQPTGLVATLRPYQRQGLAWIWNNLANGFGCLLADDMGLGKTLQAIGILVKWKDEGRLTSPGLVVVPASLITNWQRELARFSPGLSLHTHHGPKRRLDPSVDVVLTTYETVLRDVAGWGERSFSLVILDEAHGLKNAAAKRSLAIRKVRRSAILALTGTPVENRLEDLRALFDLVMPGYLGEAGEFRTRWRIPIELHGNTETANRLKRITGPFLLRRLKTDPTIVPDLPEKTVIDEYATLSKEQSALYQAVLDELAADPEAFDDARERQALVFQLLTALKQVCNHPRAYDGESPLDADLSGKATLLLDLLETILESGEKVLVFSQYVETLKILDRLIRDRLDEAPLMLHGGLSTQARSQAVDAFQGDPSRKIFLISLKAGGVGLNLTAASRVVHFDLWYNPAVENQATDRAFRIGQTRRVFVHRLICVGTFEEKIDAMIKAKKALADLSVGTGESWLADLGAAELRKLFSN